MAPIVAANYFATLVGLICSWKADRGATATENFQDFVTYLANHNFEELRTEIITTRVLQDELKNLLDQDFADVSSKLDLVCTGLSSLSDKIEALAPLVRTLRAPTDSLSPQATGILKVFEQSGAVSMMRAVGADVFQFFPGGNCVRVAESRFVNDDIQSLLSFGLIQEERSNSSPFEGFVITRLGARYAEQLPALPLAMD